MGCFILARWKAKGREGGRGETDRVLSVTDTESAELRVLSGNRADRWSLSEKTSGAPGGELYEGDARARGDRGQHVGELRASASGGPHADDHGWLGLDDEASEAEPQRVRVLGRKGADPSDVPGIERRVLDPTGPGKQREHAGISPRGLSFEHRRWWVRNEVGSIRPGRAGGRSR